MQDDRSFDHSDFFGVIYTCLVCGALKCQWCALQFVTSYRHVKWVPCRQRMACPQVKDGRDGFQIWSYQMLNWIFPLKLVCQEVMAKSSFESDTQLKEVS